MPQVYFAALKERALLEEAVDSVEGISVRAGQKGYVRLSQKYMRTDITRNMLSRFFQQEASNPDDCLVMLDYDHKHPYDVIERLVAHQVPVVSCLAFRRGPPHYPCVWVYDGDGLFKHPKTWEPKLYRVAVTGSGAICIRRSVFDTLKAKGHRRYFKYTYPEDSDIDPSEEIYFNTICREASIPIYCDFSFESPHLTSGFIQSESWQEWLSDHPDGNDPETMDLSKVLVQKMPEEYWEPLPLPRGVLTMPQEFIPISEMVE